MKFILVLKSTILIGAIQKDNTDIVQRLLKFKNINVNFNYIFILFFLMTFHIFLINNVPFFLKSN